MKRMLSAALALLMLIGTAIPAMLPTVTAAEPGQRRVPLHSGHGVSSINWL